MMPVSPRSSPRLPRHSQHGASLIVVLMVLVIVSLLGLAAAQLGIQGERAARNDRDRQIAMQAAEAALTDAEFDIEGTAPASSGKKNRAALFQRQFHAAFEAGCGTSTTDANGTQGLCAQPATDSKPAWLTINLAQDTTRSVAFGTFTARSFPANEIGIQPARPPRYIIENIRDYGASADGARGNDRAYRITAVGFGPRDNTYVVLQTIYRK